MDGTITHDSLYKAYINNQYGPNFLPIIKSFSIILVFALILIIITSNLHDSLKPEIKIQSEQTQIELGEPIVYIKT
jgi:hypothetical protein